MNIICILLTNVGNYFRYNTQHMNFKRKSLIVDLYDSDELFCDIFYTANYEWEFIHLDISHGKTVIHFIFIFFQLDGKSGSPSSSKILQHSLKCVSSLSLYIEWNNKRTRSTMKMPDEFWFHIVFPHKFGLIQLNPVRILYFVCSLSPINGNFHCVNDSFVSFFSFC